MRQSVDNFTENKVKYIHYNIKGDFMGVVSSGCGSMIGGGLGLVLVALAVVGVAILLKLKTNK